MSLVAARLRDTLGARLGWVVKASGKSHAELAGLLGIHQTTLSACIRGKTFSVERIAEILEQLGHTVEFATVEGEEDVRKLRKKRGTLEPVKELKNFLNVARPGGMMVKPSEI